MGTCSETICKHRILFPSVQHLAWFPQGRPRENKNVVKIAILGLTHWLKHRITRKLLKIDRYMLRGVWQALNCLSIHATYCMIVAGASPWETKMWAAVRENGDFYHVVINVKTNQGLKLCVFWHKVCSWLCQVCSWLCWSVLCEVAKCNGDFWRRW